MRPSTHQPIGMERIDSTSNADPHTATIPKGTSAILVTVETNACRATLTATGDPTTTTSHVIQKDQNPWHMLIGQGATVKFASASGSPSSAVLTYLQ